MKPMKRGNVNQLLCLLFVLTATPVYADPIIFQSALLGPTGQSSGTTISPFQFLGGAVFDLGTCNYNRGRRSYGSN